MGDVESNALRNALRNVEKDDVAEFPHGREVGERSADHSGADQGNLLAGHLAAAFLLLSEAPTTGAAKLAAL